MFFDKTMRDVPYKCLEVVLEQQCLRLCWSGQLWLFDLKNQDTSRNIMPTNVFS